jgi:signal transduction histidine kinase
VKVRTGSLRVRLLGVTLATLALALFGAHWWLAGLFRDHVVQQFDVALSQHLDQLTARLEVTAQGLPVIGMRGMSDPRWEKAYSGLYWQVERVGRAVGSERAALRSRSLWDTQLTVPDDALSGGEVHRHEISGPRGERLRVVERTVQSLDEVRWRLIVAGDIRDPAAAVEHFSGVLGASLGGLGVLLVAAALAQVGVGLAPLKTMKHALQRVREGRERHLEGQFPSEVQPLVDELNSVLDRNAELVERARAQAGNLAHALKTPLAILRQAARDRESSALADVVTEQVDVAERHMNWYLARARAAVTTQTTPGQRTLLEPVLQSLLRTMDRLHADRRLDLGMELTVPDLAFAGEAQDLHEMLGNLIDNACRSARTTVVVGAKKEGTRLRIAVDDDGPGIDPERRDEVLRRGVRLDETHPGSGLGLAIVVDLARLYGGDLTLEQADIGGLSAQVVLPAAD